MSRCLKLISNLPSLNTLDLTPPNTCVLAAIWTFGVTHSSSELFIIATVTTIFDVDLLLGRLLFIVLLYTIVQALYEAPISKNKDYRARNNSPYKRH